MLFYCHDNNNNIKKKKKNSGTFSHNTNFASFQYFAIKITAQAVDKLKKSLIIENSHVIQKFN